MKALTIFGFTLSIVGATAAFASPPETTGEGTATAASAQGEKPGKVVSIVLGNGESLTAQRGKATATSAQDGD